ncbi:MAG: peptide deformylase [Candidatus Cloacimonetes bacterium]|nr:peptide deformylase [Candidatus Cloacimonadota bacterium]
MVINEIIQIGNPILSRPSKFVAKIDAKETQRVIKNLVDSVRHHDLIGMAASQIGEKLRIFVTEVRKTKYRNLPNDKLRVYINPEIVWSSKKQVVIYEGCGSVAYTKLFAPVRRPEKITIEACDENGNKFRLNASGMLSRVIQHEHDHLNGIEFTEKITDMRKIMSSEEYLKMVASKK